MNRREFLKAGATVAVVPALMILPEPACEHDFNWCYVCQKCGKTRIEVICEGLVESRRSGPFIARKRTRSVAEVCREYGMKPEMLTGRME